MSTIGVYDADFFRYEELIPNLECAKLVTYFRQKKEIAALVPTLCPQRYTWFYIRKDINDGRFPKDFFLENCVYGGRAFESIKYYSLSPEIEQIIPDMHVYQKYEKYYSQYISNQRMFRSLLNRTHIRLQPSDDMILSVDKIIDHMRAQKSAGLVLHDYDIASIPDIFDRLKEISNSRYFREHPDVVRPYKISNKFPIWVDNDDGLYQWATLPHLKDNSYIGCNYFRTDGEWVNFFNDFPHSRIKIGYKIDKGCTDEVDFLNNRLPQIYKQVLYFWRMGKKFLLEYDTNFIKTTELRNLISFINFRFNLPFPTALQTPQNGSLSSFCRYYCKQPRYGFREKEYTTQELRDSFQYVRERNYEFFRMFYEWDKVIYKNGGFKSEWA